MAINDILEVKFYTAQDVQLGINIRHFRIEAVTGVELTHAELALAWNGLVSAAYKALMSTAADFRGVGVRKIRPTPQSIETFDASSFGPGTRAGDPLPLQTSGLISLRTATPGRKGRGRLYVPFPAETDNSATANPTAGYVTNLLTLATFFNGLSTFSVGINSTSVRSVIFNRPTGLGTNVTSTRQSGFWATQRRRGDLGAANLPLPV